MQFCFFDSGYSRFQVTQKLLDLQISPVSHSLSSQCIQSLAFSYDSSRTNRPNTLNESAVHTIPNLFHVCNFLGLRYYFVSDRWLSVYIPCIVFSAFILCSPIIVTAIADCNVSMFDSVLPVISGQG